MLLREAIAAAIAKLSPPQAAIVRLRFGLEGGEMQSSAEVGEELGLSKQAVTQQLQTNAQSEPALTLHKHTLRAQLTRRTIQQASD